MTKAVIWSKLIRPSLFQISRPVMTCPPTSSLKTVNQSRRSRRASPSPLTSAFPHLPRVGLTTSARPRRSSLCLNHRSRRKTKKSPRTLARASKWTKKPESNTTTRRAKSKTLCKAPILRAPRSWVNTTWIFRKSTARKTWIKLISMMPNNT